MSLTPLASAQSSRETQASSPRDISLFRDIEEATMPFSVYAAMLSSQLIVTVAGRVPEFDVGPSCRESTVSDCLSMERFAEQDREVLGFIPVYVNRFMEHIRSAISKA